MCPPSAFNNILSNLGYILLGLLFLLIILQREINHNRALLRNDLYALVGAPARPAPHCPPPAPPESSLLQAPPCLTSSLLLCPPTGVWDPQTLWPVLRHGHSPHDGGPAERLLPCLPQLYQLPVW